jgi:hypothetical protein
MKTMEVRVTGTGAGLAQALESTEQFAQNLLLEKKDRLHLRLLAEELLGLIRSMIADLEADYWLEQAEGKVRMHLTMEAELSREEREALIALSTSKENEAAKGIMGRIKDMITTVIAPGEEGPSLASLGVMSLGSPNGYRAGTYDWSLQKYRDGVADDEEAMDELERSIIASIADEVRVSIEGTHVEITVDKAF